MSKPTAQQCHALITYFINKYTEVTGAAPLINRNKARFGFEGLLFDYTPEQARQLVDHYIEHYATPTIDWFTYNYEKVDEALKEYEQNKVAQAKRREATAQRLEEWRKRWKT